MTVLSTLLTVSLTAACGGTAAEPTWVAPPSTAPAKPESTKVAKITSACRLLPASAVIKSLGGTAQTKLAGREDAAEKGKNGSVWRYCAFGRDGREPFVLGIGTLPNRAQTVKETIDNFAQAGGTDLKRIDGLGADAVGFVNGANRSVVSAVPFQRELRVVIFTGPKLVPQDRLQTVVRQVVAQI